MRQDSQFTRRVCASGHGEFSEPICHQKHVTTARNMNTTTKTETDRIAKAVPSKTGDGTPQKTSADSAAQKPSVQPAIAKRKKWWRLLVILALIALAAGVGFYT